MQYSFKTQIQQNQFMLFLLVGGFNTLFGYLIFAALIYSGVHYAMATLIATCIGVLFNFKTLGKFVFNNTSNHLIIRFISSYTVIYFTNISIIKFAHSFSVNLYIAGGIATIFCAIQSYTFNKYFVFREVVNENH